MIENRDIFLKGLSELRELALKGPDADPKKFNSLAKSLVWDVQSSFVLPMSPEQMELIKILKISEAGGEYWKGYGEALTDFLLPLHRSAHQAEPAPEQKPAKQPSKNMGTETKQPISVPPGSDAQAQSIFIMD